MDAVHTGATGPKLDLYSHRYPFLKATQQAIPSNNQLVLAGVHRQTQGRSGEKPVGGKGEGPAFGDSSRIRSGAPSGVLTNLTQDPKSLRSCTERSALCQGPAPTHLHEIKTGQEGDAVLDHFALWPLLRRHPGRLPGSASSPGRGVHRAAKASCLLQPQAPGPADVTFPAGTAGASALHAAPPPSPRLSLQ